MTLGPARVMDERIITVNVGGVYFTTRLSTLAASDSFFSGCVNSHPECTELFIDRDPTHFRHILNWMRGVHFLPEDDSTLQELAYEADYYCLSPMKEAIVRTKDRYSVARSIHAIHGELKQR
jgi:hypothetical protein